MKIQGVDIPIGLHIVNNPEKYRFDIYGFTINSCGQVIAKISLWRNSEDVINHTRLQIPDIDYEKMTNFTFVDSHRLNFYIGYILETAKGKNVKEIVTSLIEVLGGSSVPSWTISEI